MDHHITDQDLHCIARKLQVEKYTPEEKKSRSVHPCSLCKYAFTCHPPVGIVPLPIKRRRTNTDVVGELIKLTGVNIYCYSKGVSLEETLLQGSWADTMPLEECVKPFEENIRVYTEAMEFMDPKRGQDDEEDQKREARR